MCGNRGQIYTIQQEENTGHNQGSSARCQICEVRFLRPEEVSNKVRAGRIWSTRGSGLWYGSGQAVQDWAMNHAEAAEPTVNVVSAAKDRVGSDSFKQLFRKGQHHLLNRIFLAFPSFYSVSLLTLILFWSHFPPMMHVYWASFTKGLATKAEKSYSAALAPTSKILNSPFYLKTHQLASLSMFTF